MALEELIRSERAKHADAMLFSFRSNTEALLQTWERLVEIDTRLSGQVSSPQIKSSMAASYKESPKVYHSEVTALMMRRDELVKKYVDLEEKVQKVSAFLQTLDQEEVELASLVYEYRYTVKGSADIMDISRRKAHYLLSEIRYKYR